MRLSVEEVEQVREDRGLTAKQWAIVAATTIGAIIWVFVVSPQSNYWDTTGVFYISAEGEPPLILNPDSDGYGAARAELEDFQADAPGTYSVSLNTYLSIKAALGLQTDPEEEARLARWNERTEHWANLRAFLSSTADGVLDREDAGSTCTLLPQWEGQLAAAQVYVAEYREVEPDTVRSAPILLDLESEAGRGLDLLSQVDCTGPIASLK